MIQDILKGLKDAGAGLLLMLIGQFTQGLNPLAQWTLILAGAVVAILGVVLNAVVKDFNPIEWWGRVVKDSIVGILTAAMPFIQEGAQAGQPIVYILAGLGIIVLSVFGNVLRESWDADGIWAKVIKDLTSTGLLACAAVFQTALTSGQSLSVALTAAGTALLAVVGNVVKSNFLGMKSPTASK